MKQMLFATTVALAISSLATPAVAYDPLRFATDITLPRELTVADRDRDRVIPLLVSLPEPSKPAPVILFSHGLGGSREGCGYLREHWSARGYAAVFLQHPGSDASVWRDVPQRQRLWAMKKAASMENMQARVDDVAAVLDALAEWQQQPGHPLAGRLDLEHVGMSGHSFGARTTQAVAGQTGWPARDGPDNRIDAAVIFSPSAPRLRSAEAAFGSVTIPWLLMTGTDDVAPIGGATVASRLAVF
ncbi:MAG: dienelactone hydrolase, partial [Planctomycetia bacterium]|nr:dienelactone hydrolase [Planctomycetia bacterium]